MVIAIGSSEQSRVPPRGSLSLLSKPGPTPILILKMQGIHCFLATVCLGSPREPDLDRTFKLQTFSPGIYANPYTSCRWVRSYPHCVTRTAIYNGYRSWNGRELFFR